MSNDKEKPDPGSPLEKAKAGMFYWATRPRTETEHLSFSRVNKSVPWAVASFLKIMDRIEQLSQAKFDKKNPHKFNTNEYIQSDMSHEMVRNLMNACVSVDAHRAKLIMETVKDMNRPQVDIMAGLGGVLGKDEDTEKEEEL